MTESVELVWHELGDPEGKGFTDTIRKYDRLPGRAESRVPEVVWDLSRKSSSLYSRFRTNATAISARWSVSGESLALAHMPATSVSGLDLYGETSDGTLRWVGVAQPTALGDNEAPIVEELDGVERGYTVYFPLFTSLDRVQIGVPVGATFETIAPDDQAPVVYYGTSIIHGASASRSGMALPAQLGRRLGRPVVGLGMSGNGRMEVEMAEHIAEIDAAVYMIDCLPNMDFDLVRERTTPFVTALRKVRPDKPVLLVEDRTLENAWAVPSRRIAHDKRREEYRKAYDALVAAGDSNLHYLKHDSLLGDDGDATVDSSHPTDLGFYRMADVIEPILRKLIG